MTIEAEFRGPSMDYSGHRPKSVCSLGTDTMVKLGIIKKHSDDRGVPDSQRIEAYNYSTHGDPKVRLWGSGI